MLYRAGQARAARAVANRLGIDKTGPVDSVNQEIAGSFDVVVLVGSRSAVGLMSRLRRPAAVPVLVFAGLVVATFAAFFVTTRLKRAAPVIEQLTFRRSFSPNGDGRFDVALFAFRLRRSDDVTVSS